ncbi:MAG: DUF4375 domain-containing protein [Chloracidobacterium sp.]|nr:DUF4375 domain-containing protein [Chloracidobacterium sp.]
MDKNHFQIALCESNRTDYGRVDFDAQSDAQKVFSATWELESQVNNGGFNVYFYNSDSDIIEYAPAAPRAIGAFSCPDIVGGATADVAPLPPIEDDRRNALAALNVVGLDRLNALDSEFFEYPDNLTETLFEFVYQHSDTFGPIQS